MLKIINLSASWQSFTASWPCIVDVRIGSEDAADGVVSVRVFSDADSLTEGFLDDKTVPVNDGLNLGQFDLDTGDKLEFESSANDDLNAILSVTRK